ncbi:hypothetical protein EYF80_001621 [Liparis tanakae]|uniref:Uncharacterized protein n=1 Tax=Liparis tanakae TaxID=230148 RepID=A0A4Z2JCZ5_9TELE|nr:hypothetical protein EYF80_001621 [Liparis tanakae]
MEQQARLHCGSSAVPSVAGHGLTAAQFGTPTQLLWLTKGQGEALQTKALDNGTCGVRLHSSAALVVRGRAVALPCSHIASKFI